MGEEAELQAKVVALINRQLGDSLAGAPLITAFRDELEAKRRCVETRYEPPKNCFASAGGYKQGCGSEFALFGRLNIETVEGLRRRGGVSKMVAWRVCVPLFADSHHFDEEQDPDPHLSEKSDQDPC
jgi:hypothetical protein